ncbi:MAG TPA: hypothetical protein VKF32_01370, partial [Thermoanaerobaculia bacterium]|nr:hypothetical protein [Thermoanaerobaculia bacterium]
MLAGALAEHDEIRALEEKGLREVLLGLEDLDVEALDACEQPLHAAEQLLVAGMDRNALHESVVRDRIADERRVRVGSRFDPSGFAYGASERCP